MEWKRGYIVGNPVTYEDQDNNERIPYAHRVALISDKQFEMFSLFICKFKLVPTIYITISLLVNLLLKYSLIS